MADEPIVFTVRYTREACWISALRYWQRRLGARYAIELVIGVGLIVLATQGPYRWLEIAITVAVSIFALLGAGLLVIHWRRALAGLAALDPPESTWILTEEVVGQRSSLGESAIAWTSLAELWKFEDVWLLIWGRDVYSTIPIAQFPRQARQFVERRVRESGGRIRG
jgi:hypothetical protein